MLRRDVGSRRERGYGVRSLEHLQCGRTRCVLRLRNDRPNVHGLRERHLFDRDKREFVLGVDYLLSRNVREHGRLGVKQSGLHGVRLRNVHHRVESELVLVRIGLPCGD